MYHEPKKLFQYRDTKQQGGSSRSQSNVISQKWKTRSDIIRTSDWKTAVKYLGYFRWWRPKYENVHSRSKIRLHCRLFRSQIINNYSPKWRWIVLVIPPNSNKFPDWRRTYHVPLVKTQWRPRETTTWTLDSHVITLCTLKPREICVPVGLM